MTASTPTKRTVKIELRVHADEKQRFHALATARGATASGARFTISDLVRERFPEVFGSPTVPRGHRSASDGKSGNNGTVDLSEWLADRTGAPRALMRLAIAEGRVSVDDKPSKLLYVKREFLPGVLLDGKSV